MLRKPKISREKLRIAVLPAIILLTALTADRTLDLRAADNVSPSAAVASTGEVSGVISEYGGCIAVFSPGAELPYMVTEVPVSGLREADRELVQQGILVSGNDELLSLLEDLSS